MEITIATDFIKLDSLLKFAGIAPTGGIAKEWIFNGDVSVNETVCMERGKKIRPGDTVAVAGKILTVTGESRENQ